MKIIRHIKDKIHYRQLVKEEKQIDKQARKNAILKNNKRDSDHTSSNTDEEYKPKEDIFISLTITQMLKERQQIETAIANNNNEVSCNGFINYNNFQPDYNSKFNFYNRDRDRIFVSLFKENFNPICYTIQYPRLFEDCYDNNIMYASIIDLPIDMSFSNLIFMPTQKDNGSPKDENDENNIKQDIAVVYQTFVKAVTISEIIGGCYVKKVKKNNKKTGDKDLDFIIKKRNIIFDAEHYRQDMTQDEKNKNSDDSIKVSSCDKPMSLYWQNISGGFGLSFFEKRLYIMKNIDEALDRLFETLKILNLKAIKMPSSEVASETPSGRSFMTNEKKKQQDEYIEQMKNLDSKQLTILPPGYDLIFANQTSSIQEFVKTVAFALQCATGIPANVFTSENGGTINIGNSLDTQEPLLQHTINKFRKNYQPLIDFFVKFLENKYQNYTFTTYYKDAQSVEDKYNTEATRNIIDALSSISNIQSLSGDFETIQQDLEILLKKKAQGLLTNNNDI